MNIQAILLSGAVAIILGVIAKKYPREKLWKIAKPTATISAKAVDVFLMKWLSKKTAEKFEEGLICSLCYIIEMWTKTFRETLLKNNDKREEKK